MLTDTSLPIGPNTLHLYISTFADILTACSPLRSNCIHISAQIGRTPTTFTRVYPHLRIHWPPTRASLQLYPHFRTNWPHASNDPSNPGPNRHNKGTGLESISLCSYVFNKPLSDLEREMRGVCLLVSRSFLSTCLGYYTYSFEPSLFRETLHPILRCCCDVPCMISVSIHFYD